MFRISLFIIFFISVSVHAIDCDLAKALNHPALAGSAEFWGKLGQLKNDSRAVEALIRQYAPQALTTGQTAVQVTAASTREAFSLSRKAVKARSKLSKTNQQHFDEFIQVVAEKGTKGLYEQPARWHFEKLKESGQHTVRLDSGNRVLFTLENGVVRVLDIGNHISH